MEEGIQVDRVVAIAHFLECALYLSDFCTWNEVLKCETAKGDDLSRIDETDLLGEPAGARADLDHLWIAVFGRSTANHVRDKDLLARYSCRLQHRVEEPAGRTDKGNALPILTGARCFTHKEDGRARAAGTGYDLRTTPEEIATGTSDHDFVELR